jgi:hypothetical protein
MCWARDPQEAGKKKDRLKKPIEDKESYRWLKSFMATTKAQAECQATTTLVNVGDRESDIYELFDLVHRTEAGPQLLVRADRARRRQACAAEGDEEMDELWETMGNRPVGGEYLLFVPGRGSRKAREANLEVRFAEVTLKPPKARAHKKGLEPLKMWAIHAKEVDVGDDVADPLDWMLLTTVRTDTIDEALERLRWYTLRWNIEVYFRILKSGCSVEDRRLGNADSLLRCLAIDLIVAWRVYYLVKQGRETPNMPCDAIFEEYEWKTLYHVSYGKPPPDKPISLREATRLVAKLGGFLGRKGDGDPGATTVWRGLGRLGDMAMIYRLMLQPQKPP